MRGRAAAQHGGPGGRSAIRRNAPVQRSCGRAVRRGATQGRVGPGAGGYGRQMPLHWAGLALAFVSAIVTNMAYSLEHDAATELPPLSPRRPLRSAALLLRDRRWLAAFAAETAGWLMYVAALRLAPLALVQAVVASGVAVLAFATARGHPSRLARRERLAVVLALAGLILLALSLLGSTASDRNPPVVGMSVLQSAYQRGDALTAAGLATMVTNAVPIAAGFVLFGEVLPRGVRAAAQIAALACLVLSAVALGHPTARPSREPTAQAAG